MEYNIELPEFEGPLDLLLHLIKQDNISIFDISIDKITKQYLDYIHKMEELNLNIASEYLVMASDLLQIKSKTLLPKKDNEEDEEDPREELINRLINYQNYKTFIFSISSKEGLSEALTLLHFCIKFAICLGTILEQYNSSPLVTFCFISIASQLAYGIF